MNWTARTYQWISPNEMGMGERSWDETEELLAVDYDRCKANQWRMWFDLWGFEDKDGLHL